VSGRGVGRRQRRGGRNGRRRPKREKGADARRNTGEDAEVVSAIHLVRCRCDFLVRAGGQRERGAENARGMRSRAGRETFRRWLADRRSNGHVADSALVGGVLFHGRVRHAPARFRRSPKISHSRLALATMSLSVLASGALLLAAAASLPSAAAQDPAPGWLSYAVGVNPRFALRSHFLETALRCRLARASSVSPFESAL
jgi:hypothetical protein